MKNKSVSQSALIGLFAVLTFAVCSSPAQATSTTWTGTSGDWFTGTNWSNGVPTCSLDAYINNDGKAEINSSGATALSLTLGANTTNSGTVSVDGTNGGTLLVQGCPSAPIRGPITVGYQGTGTLTISNGGLVQSGSGYIAASTSSSAASNGSVTVAGSSSAWQIGDLNTLHSVLFVGGNENGDGGTALLSITNGGTVTVQDNGNELSATVGPSGTVTGNGTLDTSSSKFQQLTDVYGTLAPNWTLTIGGNLRLESIATTNCNVTPQNSGSVDVSVSGTASLNGRLSVTMTGTFTCATTQYTLLYTAGTVTGTFSSVSIKYPTNQHFIPNISYDANHVYLNLVFSNPPCG
jgi:T5SS/PEP-CTERM-associated repeat protein